ncbi:uncharacterized protein LOC111627908 [Centruroides sculpturatus]|uniref:uncharacterized protein LOC111627908 n=1 Tax=Centruroides sculpturatus TaxID=218467 RepID=UPI000C6D3864|nr:uncharacterized protein LOC111627908 [Centruroides sculpturatus]
MTFRILIGCWILIAFVLTSAYVGTLPSFMVNPGTESIPQTFQELIQSVKAGRYNITFFKRSDECRYFDRCISKLWSRKNIIKNDVIEIFYENVEKCNEPGEEPIPKLLNGTHALLATREKIELSLTKWEKEKVFVSEDILFTKFQFIQINLVRVNYAVEVAKTVNVIEQSGLSQKIYTDMLDEKRKSNLYNDKAIDTNDEEPLKIDDIMGLLGYPTVKERENYERQLILNMTNVEIPGPIQRTLNLRMDYNGPEMLKIEEFAVITEHLLWKFLKEEREGCKLKKLHRKNKRNRGQTRKESTGYPTVKERENYERQLILNMTNVEIPGPIQRTLNLRMDYNGPEMLKIEEFAVITEHLLWKFLKEEREVRK